MACRRMATCRARFARGEQACVRCAEGKLDIGDVEDLDDEEDNLGEEEIDDDDDDVDDDDDDDDDDDADNDDGDGELVGYTSQPDGKFGAIAYPIEINGHRVSGFRVTLTFENGEAEEYVLVVEDGPGAIPDDVIIDIDPEVDWYVKSYEQLYDVLEKYTGLAIKLK